MCSSREILGRSGEGPQCGMLVMAQEQEEEGTLEKWQGRGREGGGTRERHSSTVEALNRDKNFQENGEDEV